MTRRWAVVLLLGALLGVIAWLSNITTEAQLSGQDRAWWTVRTVLSRLVNSGTVWAGLPVLAGWVLRRPVHSALGGVLVAEVALVVHYWLGSVTGTMPWTAWTDNLFWFLAAAVLCAPLGLVGALAHRRDVSGLLARLVVPVGAVLEPFVTGLLDPSDVLDRAARVASVVSGGMLLVLGVAGVLLVARRQGLHRRVTTSRPSA